MSVKISKNRFGECTSTAIPSGAQLAYKPGHKLRTSNAIVDRKALTEGEVASGRQQVDSHEVKILPGQEVRFVEDGGQVGIVRFDKSWNQGEDGNCPNMFTGPTFRTQRERFRFDGHKLMYHPDRVALWERGEKFAPIHIDMGLTKFCNTACLYCYAVVQNMTQGTMIQRNIYFMKGLHMLEP